MFLPNSLGHHTSLVAVQVLEGTPQLVTADLDGIFKLWDMRTLEVVQTWESHQGLNSFTFIGPHNQIVAGGESEMIVFEYDKPGVPWYDANRGQI
mgnify:CR=1 FL=1